MMVGAWCGASQNIGGVGPKHHSCNAAKACSPCTNQMFQCISGRCEKTSISIIVEMAALLIETIPAHPRVACRWFFGPIIIMAKPTVVAEHAMFRDVGHDDTAKAETELE